MDVISRKDAHEKGLLRFFTGKPCKRGHLRERNVKTGACLGCLAHYARQYGGKFNNAGLGFETVGVSIHPDDATSIRTFANLFRAARIAGTALPMVPRADEIEQMNTFLRMMRPVVTLPTPAPTSSFDKLATWTRIYGEDIAQQMLERGL